jgi:S-adenosylmethionine:tRNA ribosyltransferase-isomerase
LRLSDFDYEIPAELIAQSPIEPRDSARLLVMDRLSGHRQHRVFRELGVFLRPGDRLVLNDTRVIPARLYGRRVKTGGVWEGLFLSEESGRWKMLTKTRGRIEPGERIAVEGRDLELEHGGPADDGSTWVIPPAGVSIHELMEEVGHIPLPPYIRRGRDEPADRNRYQTVYADPAHPGAVAAPTAGLHFTPELLARLAAQGIGVERVTLHVGPGTFQPVKVDRIDEHRMHAEWCELTPAVAERLRATRAAGGRVIAVGTTVVRTLESAARGTGQLEPFAGPTDLFIRPGFEFRAVDAMITNFHVPKSTLVMLVAAFAGRENILNAYKDAVQREYRFFSYGDAMLLVHPIRPSRG